MRRHTQENHPLARLALEKQTRHLPASGHFCVASHVEVVMSQRISRAQNHQYRNDSIKANSDLLALNCELTSSEKLLEKLERVAKSPSKDSQIAQSLMLWYMRNQSWTEKQSALAKKLVKQNRLKGKPSNRRRPQYVYVVTDGEHVKIGYACNVAARITALQTGSPRPISLLASYNVGMSVSAAKKAEKRAHQACRKLRIRGEWFEKEAASIVQSLDLA